MPEINTESFRFFITLYQRQDSPDTTPGATGLIESQINSFTTAAAIEPLTSWSVYNSIFAGVNGDRGVTHRITTRWLPLVDNTWVIQRVMTTPDAVTRTETYRIWRVLEVNTADYPLGQYVQYECTLENIVYS